MTLRVDQAAITSQRAREAAGEATDERIPIAISSESPVERYDWWEDERYLEVLSHAPGDIDLSYARDGLPFLREHRTDLQVGLIEDITLDEDGRLRGFVRFGAHPDAAWIREDMLNGIRKKISVGYRLSDDYEQVAGEKGAIPTRRYRNWRPMEASSVPIPADYEVGVGRSAREGASPAVTRSLETPRKGKEQAMSDQDTAAQIGAAQERGRSEAVEIIELGAAHGFADEARQMAREGLTVDQASRKLLELVRNRKPEDHVPTPKVELSEKERKRYSFARAILSQDPDANVDAGFEREVSQEVMRKLPSQYKYRGGILIPTFTRAGLDSATATKGSELKFTQAGEFIDLLKPRLKLAQLGMRVLSGLTGPVSFPKKTARGTFTWVGENPGSDVAESNLLLDTVGLSIKTGQSTTSFSRQLLVSALSASIDAEQLVREDLADAHAIGIDAAGINGSGSSNQPRGILNTTGIGSVVGGANGAVPTFAHAVELETDVATANADIGSMAYLTTPGIRGKLKQTEKASNTAQFVWTGMAGEPGVGEVNGYAAHVSTQVPSTLTKGTAAGICHAMIFGVFSELIMGEWGALELIVDPYRLKKQGMIEVTSLQMVDFAIRQPAAFSAMQDALTS